MKKKILLVISMVLALASVFSMVAFASTPECTHVDVNTDNVCDICQSALNTKQMEFKFDPNSLGNTVPILCTGMLGIFIVTTIIIGIVILLNTILEIVDKKRKNKEGK
ncbi:MAG: hypothetical protein IJ309_02495 [Clostridia bacterium]|nr:hypothetical protein [Clostridia bacterium]